MIIYNTLIVVLDEVQFLMDCCILKAIDLTYYLKLMLLTYA